MKITVVGAGAIGGNLARRLSEAGHDVNVADARGPEVVAPEVVATGAHAVELDGAVKGRVIAATADGIHAAFLGGAILSLIAIPLAFFIRKPASSGAQVPVGH